MATICPDNSTSCLLRAILDAQSGFNWNPLNFAFTAAIGVLALAVAITTVFQGLISAGPGRVKASEAAIGPFAKYTKSRFDRKEMRLRTIAKVPFIHNFEALKGIDSDGKAGLGYDQKLMDDRLRTGEEIKTFPAKWLTLLGAAGYESSASAELVSIDTNNLPSEVAAAPAWTTVKMAIILALLSGCDNVDMPQGSDYPTVRGRKAQLRFREHPDLGTIAVFDLLLRREWNRYFVSSAWRDRALLENLLGPIFYRNMVSKFHSSGFQQLELEKIETDLKALSGDSRCGHAFCQTTLSQDPLVGRLLVPLVAQSPIFLRGVVDPESYIRTARSLTRQSSLWDHIVHMPNYSRVVESFSILGKFEEQYYGHYPAAPSGWSWLEPDNYEVSSGQSPFTYHEYSSYKPPNRRERTYVLNENIVFVHKAIDLCSSTHTGVGFKRPPTAKFNRDSLRKQLHEVDCWLSKYGGALAACETRSLLHDVVQAMLKNKKPEHRAAVNQPTDPMTSSSPTTANAGTNERIQTAEPSEIEAKRKDAMRSVLVFRAAVWATYVATAVDITRVSEELGDRIIQIL